MENLEDKLKGLTMTEDEDEIIDCEDGEEGEIVQEQLNLCLVGKIMTENSFSTEAMHNALKVAWRLGKGMVVRELDKNIFIFQFFSMMDKIKVMDGGPWSFRGYPLLLQQIEEGIQPSEIVFTKVRFWVRAYDVPLNKRTSTMAKSLAATMGDFWEYDESDPLGWTKYMRFRVDLDISKPLKRWSRIATKGGPKVIKFTYERLMNFCHACGRLGHSFQQCSSYDESIHVTELPYGNWLKASPIRNKFMDAKAEEEVRRCFKLKESLKSDNARKKLVFDKQAGKSDLNLETSQPLRSGKALAMAAQSNEKGIVDESIARFSKRGRVETSSMARTNDSKSEEYGKDDIEDMDVSTIRMEGAGNHNALGHQ